MRERLKLFSFNNLIIVLQYVLFSGQIDSFALKRTLRHHHYSLSISDWHENQKEDLKRRRRWLWLHFVWEAFKLFFAFHTFIYNRRESISFKEKWSLLNDYFMHAISHKYTIFVIKEAYGAQFLYILVTCLFYEHLKYI